MDRIESTCDEVYRVVDDRQVDWQNDQLILHSFLERTERTKAEGKKKDFPRRLRASGRSLGCGEALTGLAVVARLGAGIQGYSSRELREHWI